MRYTLFFLSIFIVMLSLGSLIVLAEDVTQEPKITKDPLLEAQKDAVDETNMLLAKITEDLNKAERRHFMFIYSNHNLIRVTEAARDERGEAVKKCGEEHADMKEPLNARFKLWEGAINEVLNEARANLDNLLIVQEYAPKKKIREIFAASDKAREKTDARFEKVPVTSKDGCTYLLGNMDDTQEKLTALLRQTLVSFSQIPVAEEDKEDAASEEAGE